MQVLSQQLLQGTQTTRSILNATAATYQYTGSLELGASDLADSGLSILITLQISIEPGIWRAVAEYEWQGGQGHSPQVQWSGLARRARLQIDISRPVSVGADINQSA